LIQDPRKLVAVKRSLYSLALSPGLLGADVSINMYLPIPSPAKENFSTIKQHLTA